MKLSRCSLQRAAGRHGRAAGQHLSNMQVSDSPEEFCFCVVFEDIFFSFFPSFSSPSFSYWVTGGPVSQVEKCFRFISVCAFDSTGGAEADNYSNGSSVPVSCPTEPRIHRHRL